MCGVVHCSPTPPTPTAWLAITTSWVILQRSAAATGTTAAGRPTLVPRPAWGATTPTRWMTQTCAVGDPACLVPMLQPTLPSDHTPVPFLGTPPACLHFRLQGTAQMQGPRKSSRRHPPQCHVCPPMARIEVCACGALRGYACCATLEIAGVTELQQLTRQPSEHGRISQIITPRWQVDRTKG